jgi:hypothetical protein
MAPDQTIHPQEMKGLMSPGQPGHLRRMWNLTAAGHPDQTQVLVSGDNAARN